MFLTRIAVAQPVFATMMMVAIAVIGAFSYTRLPVEQLPDIDFPIVAVVVSYPGATPTAVEADIIKPIEDSVATLSGLDTVSSTAQTGAALVLLQFELEVDSQVASQDVRDKIDQIEGDFPDAADTPQILRFDPDEIPILSIGVSSDSLSQGALTELADDVISTRISNISGVGRASVVGGLPEEVHVAIDPDRQASLGVGVLEVTSALAADNLDLPAGSVTDGANEESVQVEGRVKALRDFDDVIIGQRNGQPVRLGDVAVVTRDLAEPDSLAMRNGKRQLAIDVVKTQGANTVQVADDVQAEIAKMATESQFSDVGFQLLRDNAQPVRDSFHAVRSMLVEGGLLATAIVFLFLNSWRSTVITGLTLPISVLGTMGVIYFLGFTLNMMTMMALSLSVGLLIDDAIVVRENIMRHLHMGKTHRQAALDGTNEIGLAVLATTLSIVAVFLPVAFMTGIIGRFFLQFGVTVSVAVLISLFISFTLDPMLSSVWYDPSSAPGARRGWIGRAVAQFDRFFEWVGERYVGLLRLCLRHRKSTLLVAVLAFAGGIMLVPVTGTEFEPPADNSEVQIALTTPVGSTLDRTAEKIAQIDRVMKTFPEVSGTYATVNSGQSQSTNNEATIYVELVPPEARSRTPVDMTGPIREALKRIPGATYDVAADPGFGGVEAPVQVKIYGDNLTMLEALADQMAGRMKDIDGLVDVKTSLDEPQPTLGIRINRDAASDLGISLSDVGNALQPMLGGTTVSDWTDPQGDSIDVVVQLPKAYRDNPTALGALPVAANSDGSGVIRLDQVADILRTDGPGEITREDRMRSVKVTANLEGRKSGDVTPDVQKLIRATSFPPGYSAGMGGDAEDIADSGRSAGEALLLAVIFIYLVLASQFGSFLQPLAIMASLPLAIVGVMTGLLIGGSTLNVFSAIGFIMLMGLVVKNAILLVDNANHRVAEGHHLFDALVIAGRTRFRPIVMTTIAMILGMMPLALNLHGGTGQNASMAHAVIGGLISSSLLTLVVVPVILTYLDSFGKRAADLFPRAPDHHLE